MALAGMLIIRDVFDIPVIAPGNSGELIDNIGAIWPALFAVVGLLLAPRLVIGRAMRAARRGTIPDAGLFR